MKLNPDCIRDILLECEEKCTALHGVKFCWDDGFTRGGRTYSGEETLYHLRQCELTGYFIKTSKDLNRNFFVLDLSPMGHEFLANIRSQENWEETKKVASSIGSASLSALSSIASGLITAAIKSKLGI